MKTIIAFILYAMCSAAMAQERPFTLQGKVNATGKGGRAYLVYHIHGPVPIKDSVKLENGRFRFSGTLDGPEKAYLIVAHTAATGMGSKDMLEFFVEPGDMNLPAADSVIQVRFDRPGTNRDNQQLLRALNPVSTRLRLLSQALRKASGAEKGTLQAQRTDLIKERNDTLLAFIKRNPESFVSLEALQEMAGAIPDWAEVQPLFASLASLVKESPAGKRYGLQLQVIRQTAEGQQAPIFSQPDTAGNMVSLADFKGKYVLIDFWASWCKPCRAENPNVKKAFETYRERGFTVLGVSLDGPSAQAAWLKAIHDDGLIWTQVADLKGWQNEAAVMYNVHAIPQNFLIDPDGRIVAKNLRGEDLQNTLRKLL